VSERSRVLISAYACEPERGSEPGVGWNHVEQAARFHEVWVITRRNNAGPVLRRAGSLRGVHWVFHDLPRWASFWKRGQRGVHLYYYLWQIGAYRAAKRLHREIGFDIVHHVTFVNYWMPSFLGLLPVPFIWGPVGGGESLPRGFRRTLSLRGSLFEMARAAARWLGEHDPAVRLCARRARVAFATTPETAARLARLGCREVVLLGESGIRDEELQRLAAFPVRTHGAPRLMSAGRLVALKGYHLSLEAFARVRDLFPGSAYWLIGGGPERGRLEALAERLGVREAVLFTGSVPRARVLDALAECDIFVHPSLHDSGGWACPEAMAAGRPVICVEVGGPAAQVSADSGIRVPASTPENVVDGLSSAMRTLMADAPARARLARAARDRAARVFSWSGKGELFRDLYARILREG